MAALSAAPALYLEAIQLIAGNPFSWRGLIARWLLATVILLAAPFGEPRYTERAGWIRPWPGILIAFVGLAAALLYVVSGAASLALFALAVLYLWLLWLDRILIRGRNILTRWLGAALLALAAGVIPVAVAQVESSFAQEEFFAAIQVLALAGFWMLLRITSRFILPTQSARSFPGLRIEPRWLSIPVTIVIVGGLVLTIHAYQRSFFPSQAPSFQGIDSSTPFLCSEVPSESLTVDSDDLFRRLLERVEANPAKGPPEYGMLALGAGERKWADTFHNSLLDEAGEGRFTGPANSVKSVQQEAALRAYYYSRVRESFPGLFTSDEEEGIRHWFASINRRALKVEWVDWLYGLALGKWPEGPYENQENGAGLLALLEAEGLAASELSGDNREYLERYPRGWESRFRNTDDAIVYQPHWIINALFQSLYSGQALEENLRLSFEWLLLQALPDGAALRYNHPGRASLAGIAYLGAQLMDDGRYLWLSDRALANLESRGAYLAAQPGVEQPVPYEGPPPTQGSCLIYGNSGLPNQVGPLAPDKIVLRDGWSPDAAYLLLNLRFTGWHRYKATNTIALLYKGDALVEEDLDGEPYRWLPVGRSLFRDKRIPRENLNGLLIERTGMDVVLYDLTGMGGPWAQDPPYYARVERFEPGKDLDVISTVLEDWHGWEHRRTVYFYHGGPVVVFDEATGPKSSRAALAWHVAGVGQVEGRRIRLQDRDIPAEIFVLPIRPGEILTELKPSDQDKAGYRVLFESLQESQLGVVTVFLMSDWVGAKVNLGQSAEGPVLQIEGAGKHIVVPLHGEEGSQ